MLSIDEAIARTRELAKRNREQWKNCTADRRDIEHQTCEQCAEEHEQLADWLEELKALRNGLKIKCDSLNDALEKGKKVGYNKAIDECLAVLYKNAGKIISIRFYEQIFDEMKQLKVGGINE